MDTQELVRLQKLQEWADACADAETAKLVIEKEQKLRRELMAMYFMSPVEGTQYVNLPNGWKLKLVHKIDRKVDEKTIGAISDELRMAGFDPNLVFKWKPELSVTGFKALAVEGQKIAAQAFTEKPANTPTIELVEPKEEV